MPKVEIEIEEDEDEGCWLICPVWTTGCAHPRACQTECFDGDLKVLYDTMGQVERKDTK